MIKNNTFKLQIDDGSHRQADWLTQRESYRVRTVLRFAMGLFMLFILMFSSQISQLASLMLMALLLLILIALEFRLTTLRIRNLNI